MSPSPLERATQLLTAPAVETHVVGPRASWARKLALVALLGLAGVGSAMAAPVGGAQDAGAHAHEAAALNEGGQYANHEEVFDQAPGSTQADEFDPASHVVQARVVDSHLVPGSLPGLIAVGLDEHGVLDPGKMFSAWQAGGLDETAAVEFMQTAWTSGAYFDGVELGNDGDLDGQLDEFFQELGGDVSLAVPGEAAEWDLVQDYWEIMTQAEGLGVEAVEGVDMETANRAVEQAANEAGIATLRLPLSALADPGRTMAYAHQIQAINQDLARVTGWEGQVMGLAGRISYELGINLEMAKRDLGGVTGLDSRDSGVFILTGVKFAFHEWTHGARFSLGEDNTAQMQNQTHAPGAEKACFHLLVDGLDRAAPEWVDNMEQFEKESIRQYLTSPDEMMARSFEMQVELAQANLSQAAQTGAYDTNYAVSYPDIEQARAQAGQWQAWFAQVGANTLTQVEPAQGGIMAEALAAQTQGDEVAGLSQSKLGLWRSDRVGPTAPSQVAHTHP